MNASERTLQRNGATGSFEALLRKALVEPDLGTERFFWQEAGLLAALQDGVAASSLKLSAAGDFWKRCRARDRHLKRRELLLRTVKAANAFSAAAAAAAFVAASAYSLLGPARSSRPVPLGSVSGSRATAGTGAASSIVEPAVAIEATGASALAVIPVAASPVKAVANIAAVATLPH